MKQKEDLWSPGQIIPGGYRIVKQLGQGGMGTVHLLEKQTYYGEKLLFAVKIIRDKAMNKDHQQNAFIRELRNWIDLPEHPNLTQCKFFHSIHDRKVIFAEYVDGGSLSQWVRTKKIQTPELFWDIAIQSARGLAAAHDCGMLHLDVKPSNMLLTKNSVLKITDFGLSVGIPDRIITESRSNLKSSSHGMTPAFASPEQMHEKTLSHTTDQWSWAVTLFYVMSGSASWQYGIFAGREFRKYAQNTSNPLLSEPMKQILSRAFEEQPEQRWENMNHVVEKLVQNYQTLFGKKYFRDSPIFTITPKHQLTEQKSPETIMDIATDNLLKKACQATNQDLKETQLSLPIRKGSSKAKLLINLERLNHIEKLFSEAVISDNQALHQDILDTFILKSDLLSQADDLDGSIKYLNNALNHLEDNRNNLNEKQYLNTCISILNKKAGYMIRKMKFKEALSDYQQAKILAKKQLDIDLSEQSLYNLCRTQMNIIVVLGRAKQLDSSLKEASDVIATLENSKGKMNEIDRLRILAGSYTNKAASLGFMDQDKKAASYFEKAANIVTVLIDDYHQTDLINRLIQTRLNASKAMLYSNQLDKAEKLALKTIKDVVNRLPANSAQTIFNRIAASEIIIHIMSERRKIKPALEKIETLIKAVEHFIYHCGKPVYYKELINLLKVKASLFEDIGDINNSRKIQKLVSAAEKESGLSIDN